MKIDIDPGAGFCFGVEQAVDKARELLKQGQQLYGLGEMVHNGVEVKRLAALGLKTINHQELAKLKGARVLFRAHGEAPSIYELARKNGIEVINATCPIVLKLQEKIRSCYASMDPAREQIVIYGKASHPETIGLMGQIDGDAVVVEGSADLHRIDVSKKIHLFSQTTMDPEGFSELKAALNERCGSVQGLNANCTICSQMKKRKPGLAEFVGNYELILFISGKNSSNGRMLYEYCASLNPSTRWISGPDELERSWFEGFSSVGISGATSTSRLQLEEVATEIRKIMRG